MRKNRIHRLNSKNASFLCLFALIRKPVSSTLAGCLVGLLAISLQAQQPSLDQLPSNPFRTANGPTTFDNSNPKPKFGDALPKNVDGTPSSHYADVIQLDRLSPNSERPVVTAISISPQGDLLAAAGDDHAIRIVSMETGRTITTLMGHLDWVRAVEFSPDGSKLASCGNDGVLRIWSVVGAPKLAVEHSLDHALMAMSFLGNDQLYAAGFKNNIYRLDIPNNKIVIDHACECNDIRSIACSPDNRWMAYGGRDGVLRIRPTEASLNDSTDHSHEGHELMAPLHFDRIRSLQFSDDSSQITSVGEDRRIVHYDVNRRKAISQTEIGGGKLMGLCQLEPNLFAIAGADNTIRIFSDIDQRVLVKLVGHDGSVSILKKTSKHIISGSFDTTIRIWDIDRAISSTDNQGRYIHPVAAQFEDSGAGNDIK